MQPALDPIWMGPILIAFVAVWFAAAIVVFKDRPAKERPTAETAAAHPASTESRRAGAHRSVEARRTPAA